MFPEATHLIAYSIYGHEKGFVKAVLDHITGGPKLPSVGTQWRDFVHVDDVATAVEVAAGLTGTWAACTKEPVRTDSLLSAFGVDLPIVEQSPTADLVYKHPVISTGPSRVHEFIADTIAARARRAWAQQRDDWRAA
jgi:nucleoside-diphosphate-sugar epimerase